MAHVPEHLMALNTRVTKIEKQNKWLKNSMALLIVAILAMGVMGAKMGPADAHFKQITANGVTLVDDAGNKLVEIGATDAGTGLRVFNKAGKRVVGLGVAAGEHGSGIVIADGQGRPRIGLGMEAGVPSIAIVGEHGKKVMAIGGDEKGYGFVVMDENEVERAGLGFMDGNAGFMIFDDNGQYVRGIIRQKDGVHYFSYVDENGNEIIAR